MAAELAQAFREFEASDAAVAVLAGDGATFCAGADLKAIGTERGNRLSPDGDGPMGPTRMQLTKPVIAAIHGYAVAGGLERASALELAHEIARMPQQCLRGDRASAQAQWGDDEAVAMARKLEIGRVSLAADGIAGAQRFTNGKGRAGSFEDL